MSLKAYDGMMTRNDVKYLQEEIIKRLPEFKEASQNQLAKKYAELIVSYTDTNYDIVKCIEFDAINEDYILNKIKNITINNKTTLISYIFQASRILSKSTYMNKFKVNLNLTLDFINDKLLCYPNLMVNEHKKILLDFLNDWYCQNQCDRDEDVPENEWNERSTDWYSFNEHEGFSTIISIFDPDDFSKSINMNFRGELLLEKILTYIPSDYDRKRKIAINAIVTEQTKNETTDNKASTYFNIMSKIKEKDNTEIDDYINSHNITLTTIDKEFINNEIIKRK